MSSIQELVPDAFRLLSLEELVASMRREAECHSTELRVMHILTAMEVPDSAMEDVLALVSDLRARGVALAAKVS